MQRARAGSPDQQAPGHDPQGWYAIRSHRERVNSRRTAIRETLARIRSLGASIRCMHDEIRERDEVIRALGRDPGALRAAPELVGVIRKRSDVISERRGPTSVHEVNKTVKAVV